MVCLSDCFLETCTLNSFLLWSAGYIIHWLLVFRLCWWLWCYSACMTEAKKDWYYCAVPLTPTRPQNSAKPLITLQIKPAQCLRVYNASFCCRLVFTYFLFVQSMCLTLQPHNYCIVFSQPIVLSCRQLRKWSSR